MTTAPVIGIVGNDVPRQLVLATGAIPHRLFGSWAGPVSDRAASLLGAVDPVAARILTDLLASAAGPAAPAALVVCNDSASHLRLFYVLRLLTAEGLPPVHLLDLPRRDSPAARRFAARRLQAMTLFCTEVTGRVPGPAELGAAAETERRIGVAVSALRDRRRASPPRVTGTAALGALIDALSAPPDEGTARLDAAVSDVDPEAARLHVAGSGQPDPSVYAVIEQAGTVIVSDDVDTGDLAWIGEAADGDLDHVCAALAERHFARDVAAPVSLIAERAAGAERRAGAAAATIALSVRRRGDDGPAWDLTATRAALARSGIRTLDRTITGAADLAGIGDELRALRSGAVAS